jgi:thioesterase domain-containing protein
MMLSSEAAKGVEMSPVDAPADDFVVFPLTVGQEGFWFLDRLNPGNPAYNIAVRFRLLGPLHVATVRQAFNEILRRHESLRTSFKEVDGEPVQVISPSASIELPVIDVRDVPAAQRMTVADRLAVEEACKRFDLSVLPLIRAVLLRLDEQEYMLLVTVHHIVSDGWSIGVISSELGALYEAFSQSQESRLPHLSIQYGDFAVWQQDWLRNAGLAGQLAYWKRQLANVAQLEIPTDRPRQAAQTFNGTIDSLVLPRPLTDALRDFSNRQGSTMFMTCLAALKILLHRYSEQTDICVGSLVAGRNRVEIEPLIGLFVNPIVLRTDLSSNPAFPDLLARVRESVLGALVNQDVPFQRLVEELRPKRDASRHPVFQVNFIYQRDFVQPLEFSGITLTAIPSKSPGAIYDLNFFMVERADGWRASCEYNTDLFEAATIRRMLEQFQALLEGIVVDPARPISAFPLLGAEDQRRVVILPPLADPGDQTPAVRDSNVVPHVGPRDDTETRLVKICEKLLGVSGISVIGDFFDLGGHSLLAARFLAQVERDFGKRVALAEFLQAPTIERLASRIRNTNSSTKPPLVIMINPNGSKPPLIVLGGPEFRPLARRLGRDQPVLGLVVPNFQDLPTPFRVEDLAAVLVDRLLHIRPQGPYVLAGWCTAGVLAYEVAQQLHREGRQVALLVLLDTVNTSYARRFQGLKAKPARMYFMAQKVKYHVGEMRRLDMVRAMVWMRQIGQSIGLRCQLRVWRMWYRLQLLTNRPVSQALREATPSIDFALDSYQTQPCSEPLVLFRTTNLQTGRFHDPQLGWGEFAKGGLSVYEVPGAHQDILQEPAVETVAVYLNAHLTESNR